MCVQRQPCFSCNSGNNWGSNRNGTEQQRGVGLLEVTLRGSALNTPPDVVLYSDPTGCTHPCFLHAKSSHALGSFSSTAHHCFAHAWTFVFCFFFAFALFFYTHKCSMESKSVGNRFQLVFRRTDLLLWNWLRSWLWILKSNYLVQVFCLFHDMSHGSIKAWVCLWFFSRLVSACLHQGFQLNSAWRRVIHPRWAAFTHFQAGWSSYVCKREKKRPTISLRWTDFSKTHFNRFIWRGCCWICADND